QLVLAALHLDRVRRGPAGDFRVEVQKAGGLLPGRLDLARRALLAGGRRVCGGGDAEQRRKDQGGRSGRHGGASCEGQGYGGTGVPPMSTKFVLSESRSGAHRSRGSSPTRRPIATGTAATGCHRRARPST